jgi:hypothetical protein
MQQIQNIYKNYNVNQSILLETMDYADSKLGLFGNELFIKHSAITAKHEIQVRACRINNAVNLWYYIQWVETNNAELVQMFINV